MRQAIELIAKAAALCAAAFLSCGQAMAARDPLILTLSDKWVANFDDNFCQLVATLGPENSKVVAIFTRFGPGDSLNLELAGEAVRTVGSHSEVKLTIGPHGHSRKLDGTSGTLAKLPLLILPPIDLLNRGPSKPGTELPVTPEQEADVEWFEVEISGKRPLRLMLGSMAKPMKVMRTCVRTLVASWGYDLDQLTNLQRGATPVGNAIDWARASDYPREMVATGGQGNVFFRLDIDASGTPVGCKVLRKTNPDAFADLSCSLLMKRAKFLPALDAAGNPTKSLYVNSIRWILPD